MTREDIIPSGIEETRAEDTWACEEAVRRTNNLFSYVSITAVFDPGNDSGYGPVNFTFNS